MPRSSDDTRRETLATLTEIVDREKAMNAQGLDVSDPDEWQQLGDIVRRLERKWGMAGDQEAAA